MEKTISELLLVSVYFYIQDALVISESDLQLKVECYLK